MSRVAHRALSALFHIAVQPRSVALTLASSREAESLFARVDRCRRTIPASLLLSPLTRLRSRNRLYGSHHWVPGQADHRPGRRRGRGPPGARDPRSHKGRIPGELLHSQEKAPSSRLDTIRPGDGSLVGIQPSYPRSQIRWRVACALRGWLGENPPEHPHRHRHRQTCVFRHCRREFDRPCQ